MPPVEPDCASRTFVQRPYPRAEKILEAPAVTSKTYPTAPDDAMLLALYSLYKYARMGDQTGACRGMMEVLERSGTRRRS
jgi:hypothetical protein